MAMVAWRWAKENRRRFRLLCKKPWMKRVAIWPRSAIAITDHGESGKTHDTTTLDHLGDAVHGDHFFDQTVITLFLLLHFSLRLSHHSTPIRTADRVHARLQPTL